MTEQQERSIRDYIATMRAHFATYHNHKEQMAYVATGLYLTGAGALFFQKHPKVPYPELYHWSIIALVILFTLIALRFVSQQLQLRALAANIIAACDVVRLRWLDAFPAQLDIDPVRALIHQLTIDMPRFLWLEFSQITPAQPLSRLTELTVLSILLTGSLLVLRLLFLPLS